MRLSAPLSTSAALTATIRAAKQEREHAEGTWIFCWAGGAGGGWDGTARGIGEALIKSGLVKNASYQNMSGGGGGKAMAALLSGEAQFLSTGLGEALDLAKAGQIRILAVTSAERIKEAPDVPTLKEMGNDTVFANWRGFFVAPGLPEAKVAEYAELLSAMYEKPEWETVHARNGWVNLCQPGDEFYKFLEQQEETVGALMKELGFL